MLFNSPGPQLSPIHIYQYVRKTCLPARLSTWRQDNLRERLNIMAGALGQRIDTSFEDHRSRCALWEESTFCVVDWRITSYLLRVGLGLLSIRRRTEESLEYGFLRVPEPPMDFGGALQVAR